MVTRKENFRVYLGPRQTFVLMRCFHFLGAGVGGGGGVGRLYKVVLTFESVDETLKYNHTNSYCFDYAV